MDLAFVLVPVPFSNCAAVPPSANAAKVFDLIPVPVPFAVFVVPSRKVCALPASLRFQ
jgi:hypothetical protein